MKPKIISQYTPNDSQTGIVKLRPDLISGEKKSKGLDFRGEHAFK